MEQEISRYVVSIFEKHMFLFMHVSMIVHYFGKSLKIDKNAQFVVPLDGSLMMLKEKRYHTRYCDTFH